MQSHIKPYSLNLPLNKFIKKSLLYANPTATAKKIEA